MSSALCIVTCRLCGISWWVPNRAAKASRRTHVRRIHTAFQSRRNG